MSPIMVEWQRNVFMLEDFYKKKNCIEELYNINWREIMWNSAYTNKIIISTFIKTRPTNQIFIFMSSKVVCLKKHFAYHIEYSTLRKQLFFCHEMPRISARQSCLQQEQWGSQSRHAWKTSLEICYFDVFENLVKVTRQNKASQNLLYIIEINLCDWY